MEGETFNKVLADWYSGRIFIRVRVNSCGNPAESCRAAAELVLKDMVDNGYPELQTINSDWKSLCSHLLSDANRNRIFLPQWILAQSVSHRPLEHTWGSSTLNHQKAVLSKGSNDKMRQNLPMRIRALKLCAILYLIKVDWILYVSPVGAADWTYMYVMLLQDWIMAVEGIKFGTIQQLPIFGGQRYSLWPMWISNLQVFSEIPFWNSLKLVGFHI